MLCHTPSRVADAETRLRIQLSVCTRGERRGGGQGPAELGHGQQAVSRSQAKTQTALGGGWRATLRTRPHASLARCQARSWGRARTFFHSRLAGASMANVDSGG